MNRFITLEIYLFNYVSGICRCMDIRTALNQIVAFVQDRIRLVQAIIESIAAEQVHPDLTELQKQELDRQCNRKSG